jgi:hypothetical protein
MNISGVGGGSQFLSLESESLPQGGATTLSGELAVLMLDTQEHQKQLAQEQLANARQDFSEALAAEVHALHEQADATLRGAILSGSLAAVGAGVSAWGAGRDVEKPWQEPVGKGLSDLAQPMGSVVAKNYGSADAKSAEGAQQAAKWQIDDSRAVRSDAGVLQDKALDWLSSMVDRDAATTAAILANKV